MGEVKRAMAGIGKWGNGVLILGIRICGALIYCAKKLLLRLKGEMAVFKLTVLDCANGKKVSPICKNSGLFKKRDI